MSRWIGWAIATLAAAVVVHIVTLQMLPRWIEARVLARLGQPNTMHFGRRPDESFRAVVRPSPDLFYAACPFDLSRGPLRLTAHVPHTTYWSIAGFDAATNNFFVRDDQQVSGDVIELVVLRPRMAPPPSAPDQTVVYAPTDEGLFLIRLLINDERAVARLDAVRRQASCETMP